MAKKQVRKKAAGSKATKKGKTVTKGKTVKTAKKKAAPLAKKTTASRKAAPRKKPKSPRFRIRYGGDPVVVDDGGSTRIGQAGRELPGLLNSSADAIGDFATGSWCGLAYTTSGGRFTRSVLLNEGDSIRVSSGPSHWVTLTLKAGKVLTIDLSHAAQVQGPHPPYTYHVVNSPRINKVTLLRHGTFFDHLIPAGVTSTAATLFVFGHP